MKSELFQISPEVAKDFKILCSLRGKNKSEFLRELVEKEVEINKDKIEEFKRIAQN